MNGFQIRPEISSAVAQFETAASEDNYDYVRALLTVLDFKRETSGLTCDEAYLCLGAFTIAAANSAHPILAPKLQHTCRVWRGYLRDLRVAERHCIQQNYMQRPAATVASTAQM